MLILDEPTAHLDPETRSALTADLLTVTAGRATLLISHEPDGLDQVGEIIVLERGRVAHRASAGKSAAHGHPLHGTHLPGMTTPGHERSRLPRWQLLADAAG